MSKTKHSTCQILTRALLSPHGSHGIISMDLIGDFIPSSKGNKYALTIICMLTGYTFCIPIPSKKASDVVTAYVDNVYAKFGGSKKILSDNGTEFKNQLFEKVAKELGVEFKCYTCSISPTIKWENRRIPSFLEGMYVKTYFQNNGVG